MENPYARTAGSSNASPEQQRLSDYELAIGKNVDYYLPKFEALDAGGAKPGWHWPAFFVTTPWYLYRKMYLWGLLNLAYPFIALIAFSIVIAASRPSAAVTTVLLLILFLAPSALLAIFANALYWKHVNKVIHGMPKSIAQQPDKRVRRIEREGGTSLGAMLGIVLGGGVFVSGILAAIAIPAYMDYTIRAQVTEGLNLASGLKAEIADYYRQRKSWPEQSDLGSGMPAGKYVSGIEVQGGSIVITFGNQANTHLQNQRLVLSPALAMDDDITWICGNGDVEPGVRRAEGPYGADVPDKYLPTRCRTPR